QTIDGVSQYLDLYVPAKQLGAEPWVEYEAPAKPVLVYFHGGGWVTGERTSRFLGLLPYLKQGWAVVNVDYRLLDETDLEGCIRDCEAALQWVLDHADTYHLDTSHLFVSGESAGGHLALMTAMRGHFPQINGVINWYGVTDLAEAVNFWQDRAYLAQIIQAPLSDTLAFYRQYSPAQLAYPSTPPVITLHGTADENVPVSQAEALHQALDQAGIRNQLILIPNQKHGGFQAADYARGFEAIWDFFLPLP
ncbi:MAG: alpha/beta hydrolase, partial [Bacteroidota bacterium]